MNIHDYLIDQSGLDWPHLLEEWRWLLPSEFRVWLFTRVGDLFITLPDNSVHVLDVGVGELRRVADNQDDACRKIDEPGVAEDWLMIPVVDNLVASGLVLSSGTCYSFKMLPILGGSYAPEGRAVLPIYEHFGAWGLINRQIAKLPDGAQVKIKVTD